MTSRSGAPSGVVPLSSTISRIALGTAQFGLAYGATNAHGQVPRTEVARILAAAHDAGIRWLDTAPAYGDAEEVLGETAVPRRRFSIVTKTLPRPALSEADIGTFADAINRSRERLKRAELDALLVHHGSTLLAPGGDRLLDLLRRVKERGEALAIGVSVYDPAELEAILERFTPDVVQIPFNVLDQRFRRAGLLDRLARTGIEIHARSLFLQGVLLAGTMALPDHLRHLAPAIAPFEAYCRKHGLSPLEACLGVGLSTPEMSKLVIGVTSTAELADVIAAAYRAASAGSIGHDFAVDDDAIVNPSKWPPRRH